VLEKLTALFRARPIFSTEMLLVSLAAGKVVRPPGVDDGGQLVEPLQLSRSELLHHLPYLSYRYVGGPWRNLWIRHGFDPRLPAEARVALVCQVVDFRVPTNVFEEVTRRQEEKMARKQMELEMEQVQQRQGEGEEDANANANAEGGQPMDTSAASATSASPSPAPLSAAHAGGVLSHEVLDPHFSRIPLRLHTTFQLDDLGDPSLRSLVQSAITSMPSACDEKQGWVTAGSFKKIRKGMIELMNTWCAEQGLPSMPLPSSIAAVSTVTMVGGAGARSLAAAAAAAAGDEDAPATTSGSARKKSVAAGEGSSARKTPRSSAPSRSSVGGGAGGGGLGLGLGYSASALAQSYRDEMAHQSMLHERALKTAATKRRYKEAMAQARQQVLDRGGTEAEAQQAAEAAVPAKKKLTQQQQEKKLSKQAANKRRKKDDSNAAAAAGAAEDKAASAAVPAAAIDEVPHRPLTSLALLTGSNNASRGGGSSDFSGPLPQLPKLPVPALDGYPLGHTPSVATFGAPARGAPRGSGAAAVAAAAAVLGRKRRAEHGEGDEEEDDDEEYEDYSSDEDDADDSDSSA